MISRDSAITYPATELGRMLDGLTPQRLAQLADEGVIVRVERGRYDLFQSVVGYVRFLKARIVRKHAGATEGDPRNDKAKIDAERARIELETLKGERLVADDVLAVVIRINNEVRTAMLAIPAKAAPRLEGKSAAEGQELLLGMVNEALSALVSIELALGLARN